MPSRTWLGTSSIKFFSFLFGKMTRPDPGAPRAEHLLLDAADRQHPAGQRDLAGHRQIVAAPGAGQQRHQRGHHRDARRRTVLRDRAGRHVDVDVGRLAEVGADPELASRASATHDSAACADSFITSPSWPVKRQRPAALHRGRLDEQDLAAGRRPGQPVATPGISVRSSTSSCSNLRRAEELAHERLGVTSTGAVVALGAGAARPCGDARRSRAPGSARPASRVYPRISSRSAASVHCDVLAVDQAVLLRPASAPGASARCATFSSSV